MNGWVCSTLDPALLPIRASCCCGHVPDLSFGHQPTNQPTATANLSSVCNGSARSRSWGWQGLGKAGVPRCSIRLAKYPQPSCCSSDTYPPRSSDHHRQWMVDSPTGFKVDYGNKKGPGPSLFQILGDWKGGEVSLRHRDCRHLSGLLVTLTWEPSFPPPSFVQFLH